MDEKNELQKNSDSTTVPSINSSSEQIVPDVDIPTIRTFKQDISETVQRDKITTAKILMAEQRKSDLEVVEKKEEKTRTVTSVLSLFFGIIFLLSAIGVLGYFGYTQITTTDNAEPVASSSGNFLFVFDREKYVDARQSADELNLLLTEYRNEMTGYPDKTYTEVIFYTQNESTEGAQRINSLEFFRIFNIPVLTNVARSVSTEFVYGMYTTEGRAEPFLVVGLVDYENAYANMLLWENTLALDIRTIFPVLKNLFDISNIRDMVPENNSEILEQTNDVVEMVENEEQETVEAVSEVNTEETTVMPTEKEHTETINRSIRFMDVILSNQNTRAVRNENGSPFFYYAFIDKNKILFAQDPNLIGEFVRKIKQKQLVR